MTALNPIPDRAKIEAVLMQRTGLGWRVGIGKVVAGEIDREASGHMTERSARAAALELSDRFDLLVLRNGQAVGNVTRKGRTRTPPFVMLDHRVIDSAAWADLGGTAAKLLLYLARLYNGSNNGEICLAERAAADAIGVGRGAAAAAFDELEAHRFILATRRGAFQVKVRVATAWRLTFHPAGGVPATHDYRDWRAS